jgi:hypothetical protein
MSEDLTKKLPNSDSEKITLILTTVQSLETRVDHLEKNVDERLYDTRPIWQKVVADIAKLQDGQRDIKISVRELARHVEVLNDTMLKIQGEYREFSHRILDIELEHQKQRNSQT